MTNRMDIPKCPVEGFKLATEGRKAERFYCRWGQDYDCGCNYCSDSAYAAACAKAAAWNEATAEHRAWVAQITNSFRCLAAIGKVMALVASMPTAIYLFMCDAAAAFHDIPCKGMRYRIIGKRGNAKPHFGKVGVCKTFGESSYGRRPATWRGRWIDNGPVSMRIALEIAGESGVVWVPFGQVERLPEDVGVLSAKLERAIVKATLAEAGVRPRWNGPVVRRPTKKNPQVMAYVVSGRDRGASGRVFWLGDDRKTNEQNARVGIKCENGAVVWASVYDCRNEAPSATSTWVSPSEIEIAERVAADAVLAEQPEKAREILAQVA